MNGPEPIVLTVFNSWLKRILIIFLIAVFIVLIYRVLTPFLAPIGWALVLAHLTWPIHLKLNSLLKNQPTICALILVAGTALLILVPLLWFALVLQESAADGYRMLSTHLSNGTKLLPDAVMSIPWLGTELQHWINTNLDDSASLNQQLTLWAKQGSSQLVSFIGNIGRNTAKALFTCAILFVFYRNGENILHHVKAVLTNLLGERINIYFRTTGDSIRAITFGVILIAAAQGILAGIGFQLFGVSGVVLLGVLTAISSLIPIVGSFLIWGPVSLFLLINGQALEAIGLFLWGSLLIGTADNLIRPFVISKAMRVSFLLVMFGVFGGVMAFGLIGLYAGPTILAVALTIWNEWVQHIETA